MRLVTFEKDGKEDIGCMENDRIVNLRGAYMLYLVSKGESREKAYQMASETIPQTMIDFLKKSEMVIPAA